jgi:hypothetical protein
MFRFDKPIQYICSYIKYKLPNYRTIQTDYISKYERTTWSSIKRLANQSRYC